VLWGGEWDQLLDRDKDGLLVKRMGEVVDGEYQKYAVEPGSYFREHFWGKYPQLLEMVSHLSDEQLKKLTLGGTTRPRCTRRTTPPSAQPASQPSSWRAPIKGYGIGEAGEGKNITHQAEEDERRRAARVPRAVRGSRSPTRDRRRVTSSDNSPIDLHARAPEAARWLLSRAACTSFEPIKVDTPNRARNARSSSSFIFFCW